MQTVWVIKALAVVHPEGEGRRAVEGGIGGELEHRVADHGDRLVAGCSRPGLQRLPRREFRRVAAAGQHVIGQVDAQGLAGLHLGRSLLGVESGRHVCDAGNEDGGAGGAAVLVGDGVEQHLGVVGNRYPDLSRFDESRGLDLDSQVVLAAVGVVVVLEHRDLDLGLAQNCGARKPVVHRHRRCERGLFVDGQGAVAGHGSPAAVGDVVAELVVARPVGGHHFHVLSDDLEVGLPGGLGLRGARDDSDLVAVGIHVVLRDGDLHGSPGTHRHLVGHRDGKLVGGRRRHDAHLDARLTDGTEPVPHLVGERIRAAGASRGFVGQVAPLDLDVAQFGALRGTLHEFHGVTVGVHPAQGHRHCGLRTREDAPRHRVGGWFLVRAVLSAHRDVDLAAGPVPRIVVRGVDQCGVARGTPGTETHQVTGDECFSQGGVAAHLHLGVDAQFHAGG